MHHERWCRLHERYFFDLSRCIIRQRAKCTIVINFARFSWWRFIFDALRSCFMFCFMCVCVCVFFLLIHLKSDLCVSWTKISRPHGYGQLTQRQHTLAKNTYTHTNMWKHVGTKQQQKKIDIYFLLILIWNINHVWLFGSLEMLVLCVSVRHCSENGFDNTLYFNAKKSCLFICWCRSFSHHSLLLSLSIRNAGLSDIDN